MGASDYSYTRLNNGQSTSSYGAVQNSSQPSAPPEYSPEVVNENFPKLTHAPEEARSLLKETYEELCRTGLIYQEGKYTKAHKARVCVTLDISNSMENPNGFYSSDKIAALLTKALIIAGYFDNDGAVEVIPFGSTAGQIATLNLEEMGKEPGAAQQYIQRKINEILVYNNNIRGGTRYSDPLNRACKYYFREHPDNTPVFNLFITDGACTDAAEAAMALKNISATPLFLKILALEGVSAKPEEFSFLKEKVDDAAVIGDPDNQKPDKLSSCVDNADVVIIVETSRQANVEEGEIQGLNAITPADILREYAAYLRQATVLGIIPETFPKTFDETKNTLGNQGSQTARVTKDIKKRIHDEKEKRLRDLQVDMHHIPSQEEDSEVTVKTGFFCCGKRR